MGYRKVNHFLLGLKDLARASSVAHRREQLCPGRHCHSPKKLERVINICRQGHHCSLSCRIPLQLSPSESETTKFGSSSNPIFKFLICLLQAPNNPPPQVSPPLCATFLLAKSLAHHLSRGEELAELVLLVRHQRRAARSLFSQG
jgi:hypothetical protein